MGRSRWAAVGAAVAVSLGAGGVGWFAHADTPPSTFVGIAPCRLFDTRPAPDNVGDRRTPLGAGEELTRQVTGTNGNCTIPATATAIAYNLTVPSSINGFLTLFPADAPRPRSSSINPVAGESVKANGGIVGLSATGAIKLFSLTGPVDAILDITGYYTSGSPLPGVIPSGTTVTGQDIYDYVISQGDDIDTLYLDLGGIAPVPLTEASLRFPSGSVGQNDPTCTGTLEAPTAPPGKVCIYLVGQGFASLSAGAAPLANRGFLVRWRTRAVELTDLNVWLLVSWAYTAP